MKNLLPIILATLSFLALFCTKGEEFQVSKEGYLLGAENVRLHFNIMGSGEDTIVVIHGGPGAGIHSVLPSVKPLARSHVLILYDQRGGGLSELPEDTAKLQAKYFGNWDFTTEPKHLEVPLLVIYGIENSLMIPCQQSWVGAAANGRLLLVPDAGKSALSDNPDFLIPAVKTFIEGQWPESASR